MTILRERFDRLTMREKALLAGLFSLLLLLGLAVFVIGPILSLEGTAKARYAEAVRLEALAEGIEAPDAGGQSDRGLRSVVTSYADRGAVPYTRVTQTAGGEVRIDLGDTPYAAVFSWLRALEEQEGVMVVAAYLSPGEAGATVSGNLTLTRPSR